MSIDCRSRMAALEALVDNGGINAANIMPGTGLCSLSETVMLTRHAVQLGCAAVLTLPPFFYKDADDEGLYRYFSELIEKIASKKLKICLYHIPPMTGMGFSPVLARRLMQSYPDTVIAYKDSSGDWQNTRQILDQAPQLSVFPGSETFLLKCLQNGAAGCISATCNVNAHQIRRVYDTFQSSDQQGILRLNEKMIAFRKVIELNNAIPVMKALLAYASGDERWMNITLPLRSVDQSALKQVVHQLGSSIDHLYAAQQAVG